MTPRAHLTAALLQLCAETDPARVPWALWAGACILLVLRCEPGGARPQPAALPGASVRLREGE